MNIKKTVRNLVFMGSIFTLNLLANPLCVFAGDPWAALGKMSKASDADQGVKDVGMSLYRIFQKIGIYGCIITTVFFLGYKLLFTSDPRIQSEAKQKIAAKFGVAFLICATSGILGVILQIIKTAAGYN